MKVYNYNEVLRIIKKHGFVLVRCSGSHEHYKNPQGRIITLKHGFVNRMIWQRLCKENGFTDVQF